MEDTHSNLFTHVLLVYNAYVNTTVQYIVPKWRSYTNMGQQYDIKLFAMTYIVSMQLHVVHSRKQFLNASCLTKSHCLMCSFE